MLIQKLGEGKPEGREGRGEEERIDTQEEGGMRGRERVREIAQNRKTHFTSHTSVKAISH